nr:hypothetical protein [Tanacetum cinerariifolium]
AAPYEDLYGWKCRSPVFWSEVGDSQLTGPELIRDTNEKIIQIKNRLLTAHIHQKSYADRPFKIIARVSPVAYMLELHEELKGIHSTFHVSNLKKCLAEGDIIVLMNEIQLDDTLHMIEELVEVVDRENKELTVKVIALQDLNECFRTENKKVKQHYKELYDSIKLMRAKTIEKTTSLLDEIKNLKAQLKNNMKCVTVPAKTKKCLPLESVATLCEIVEEARVDKPLDSSLVSACPYTKHSQELLEYVIGTCLKDFNARDKKLASTLFLKKKVIFKEPCATSTLNTPTHPEQ